MVAVLVVLPATGLPGFRVPLFKRLLVKETELVATEPPAAMVVLAREPILPEVVLMTPVTLTEPVMFVASFIVRAPGEAPVVETAPVTMTFERVVPYVFPVTLPVRVLPPPAIVVPAI
jgi:hypothetical protein